MCACARVCTHVCVSGQSLSSLLSRQEYSSAVPFQAPDLPNTGIEPVSLPYSALAGGLFSATRETQGGKRTPEILHPRYLTCLIQKPALRFSIAQMADVSLHPVSIESGPLWGEGSLGILFLMSYFLILT